MAAYFATGLGTGWTGGQIDYRELKHKLDMEKLDRQMKQQQQDFSNEIQRREQSRLEGEFNLDKMKTEYELAHPYDKALFAAGMGAGNLDELMNAGFDPNNPQSLLDVMKPHTVPGGTATMAMPGLMSSSVVPSVYGNGSGRLGAPVQQAPQAIPGSGYSEQTQLPDTTMPGVVPKTPADLQWEKFRLSALLARYKSGHEVMLDVGLGKISREDAEQLLPLLPPGETPAPTPSGKLGPKPAEDIDLEKARAQQMKQEGDIKKLALDANIKYKNANLGLAAARIRVSQLNTGLASQRERRITTQQAFVNSQRASTTADRNDALIQKYQAMIDGTKTAIMNDRIKPGSKKGDPVYLSENELSAEAKHHMKILSGHIETLSDEIGRLQQENTVTRAHAQFFLNRSLVGDGSVQPANPAKTPGLSVVSKSVHDFLSLGAKHKKAPLTSAEAKAALIKKFGHDYPKARQALGL